MKRVANLRGEQVPVINCEHSVACDVSKDKGEDTIIRSNKVIGTCLRHDRPRSRATPGINNDDGNGSGRKAAVSTKKNVSRRKDVLRGDLVTDINNAYV